MKLRSVLLLLPLLLTLAPGPASGTAVAAADGAPAVPSLHGAAIPVSDGLAESWFVLDLGVECITTTLRGVQGSRSAEKLQEADSPQVQATVVARGAPAYLRTAELQRRSGYSAAPASAVPPPVL